MLPLSLGRVDEVRGFLGADRSRTECRPFSFRMSQHLLILIISIIVSEFFARMSPLMIK